MSALLTHLAVGVLLGMALRLTWKQIPLAALLAEVHDVDHAGTTFGIHVPGLETRATFHNVAFAVALPLLAWAILRHRGAPASWQRLAAVAPVIMTSHLFLDMITLDVSSPRIPLLYPFTRTMFSVPSIIGLAVDPTAYSTLTLLVIVLVTLVALTLLGLRAVESRPARSTTVAYALGCVLVFPALFATGFLTAAPPHVDAAFVLESAALHRPQDRLTAVVYHAGGADVGRGALRLLFLDGERVVATTTNPDLIPKGGRWFADVAAPADAPTRLVARLASATDDFVYGTRPADLVRGHVDVPLAVEAFTTDARGRGTVTLRNDGSFTIPAGALRLVLEDADAVELSNGTNPDPFGAGGRWSVTFGMSPLAAAQGIRVHATANDDGHVYLDEVRRPAVG